MSLDINDYNIAELLQIVGLQMGAGAVLIKEKFDTLIKYKEEEEDYDLVNFLQTVQNILLDDFSEREGFVGDMGSNNSASFTDVSENIMDEDIPGDTKDNVTQVTGEPEYDVEDEPTRGTRAVTAVAEVEGDINPLWRNTYTRTLNVDSQFRECLLPYDISDANAITSSSNYIFTLTETLYKVLSLELHSINLPKAWYSFDSNLGNTCFWIKGIDPIGPTTFDTLFHITPGNYTPSTLATELNTESAKATPPIDISYTYNVATGKMDISTNTYTDISFIFWSADGSWNCNENTKLNQNLGWDLGFRRGQGHMPGLKCMQNPTISYFSISAATTPLYFSTDTIVDTNYPQYLLLVVNDFVGNDVVNNIISVGIPNDEKPDIPQFMGELDLLLREVPVPEPTDFTHAPRQIMVLNNGASTTGQRATKAQLQSATSIINTRRQPNREIFRVKAPTEADVLAIFPLKDRFMQTGEQAIEFTMIQTSKRLYFGPKTLRNMHVKLVDPRGNTVNMHGRDWSFTLVIECLYQWPDWKNNKIWKQLQAENRVEEEDDNVEEETE